MGTENTCFVCQRFDGDIYDKRYEDIIEPTILDCKLKPYRVDKDPSVDQIFNDILLHIKAAKVVVAEISTDNPNVWLEVGLAIAFDKPIVFMCDNQRKDFPFDIKHRKILVYKTGSLSDYEKAKKELKNQILAKLDRWGEVAKQSRPTNKDITLLKYIANQNGNNYILSENEKAFLNKSSQAERQEMLARLLKKGYIQYVSLDGQNSYRIELTNSAYRLKVMREDK